MWLTPENHQTLTAQDSDSFYAERPAQLSQHAQTSDRGQKPLAHPTLPNILCQCRLSQHMYRHKTAMLKQEGVVHKHAKQSKVLK